MLKLLNNEEITDKVKLAFKKKLTKAYLLNDNLEITDNYLMSVDYKDEKYNPDRGFIGEAVCRSIDIKLNNKDNALDLENQDLEYRIGAKLDDGTFKYISFGNFIVQKPENTDVKEETTFTALDYMSKFDKPYEQRLTLPMTYGALAQDVCDQCGVELGSIEFRNSDKLALTNPFIGGENCREVIKSLARISFSVAYIGQDNKLYFEFEVRDTIDEENNTDEYFELSPNNRKKPINVVTLRSSEVPAAGISIKNQAAIDAMGEEVELIIEEDYFAYTDEIREDLLKEATALFGLEYDPIEIDLLGSIYLNFNDVIEITNSKGEKRKTYCINNSHTYNGALYNKIASPALTEVEDEYKYQDKAETARRRTAVEIDKANQKITLLTTNVTEQQNKISQIIIDIDTIRQEVSNIVDTTHQLSDANGYIFIEDAIEGKLYELHILGNNTVFKPLYPDEELYPNEDLYPKDGRAELTKYTAKDLQEGIEYINASILEDGTYNTTLGGRYSLVIPIKENKKYTVFREIGNTFALATYADKELIEGSIATNYIRGESSELSIETKENDKYLVLYFYNDNLADKDLETIYNSIKIYENYEVVYLGFNGTLRQLNGVYDEYVLHNGKAKIIRRINENGTVILANSYEEDLGELYIELYQGHNYITINPEIATIVLKYVRQNEFSDIYATKVEMYSEMQQLSDEINLEVGQKVNEDEIIAKLNIAVKDGQGVVALKGNAVTIESDKTTLEANGKLTTSEIVATGGNIAGLKMSKNSGTSFLYKRFKNETLESGIAIPDNPADNFPFIFAGVDAGENVYLAKAYLTHGGTLNFRSGCLNMIYEPTVDGNGIISWKNALSFTKDGIYRYLENGNKWSYQGIIYRDDLPNTEGYFFYDAHGIIFVDGLHNNQTIMHIGYKSGTNNGVDEGVTIYDKLSVFGDLKIAAKSNLIKTRDIGDAQGIEMIYPTFTTETYETISGMVITLRNGKSAFFQCYSSDSRLKEKIKDTAVSALEKINKIKHRSFYWKNGNKQIKIGYIAQELKEIDEEFVVKVPQGEKSEYEYLYQLDDHIILATATKAIQELDAKVQEQQEIIEKQQKIIDFLINKLDCKEELEEYLKGE